MTGRACGAWRTAAPAGLACCLAFGQAPAAPPIRVGGEFTVAADRPGDGTRAGGAVAYGQGRFLAVWREGWVGKGGRSRIYAARISREGKLLDPGGIALGPGRGGRQDRPRVAYAGGSFLVVWQEFNGKDQDVLGARVSPEGRVLDAGAIAVAVGPRTQALPEVAADGEGHVVVFQGFEGQENFSRIYSARALPDGTAKPPARVQDWRANPRIAWDGAEYLVTAMTPYEPKVRIESIRLDREGRPKPNTATLVTYGPVRASICGIRDGGWLVVAHRSPPDLWSWGGPGAMRGYAIRRSGQWDPPPPAENAYPKTGILEPNYLDISREDGTWPYGQNAAAFDGSRCLAVWSRFHRANAGTHVRLDNGDLVAGRVEGWKPIENQNPVVIANGPANEINPALVSDGAGRSLLIYDKQEGGRTRIAGRILTTGD